MELSHSGLSRFRVVTGSTVSELEQKARAQRQIWDEIWQRKLETEERKAKRESGARAKEQKTQLALDLTREAERAIADAEEILDVALRGKAKVDWEGMKDRRPFAKPKPVQPEPPSYPVKPDKSVIPAKPNPEDPSFQPNFDFWDRFIASRKRHKVEEAQERFENELRDWRGAVGSYNESVVTHNNRVQEIKQKYFDDIAAFKTNSKTWESVRSSFHKQQAVQHQDIEVRKRAYLDHEADAIQGVCETILMNSSYPGFCPQSFDCDYIPETKTLVIDYALPKIEDIPSRKAAKYNQTQDKIVYSNLSDGALNKLYEDVNYKIALRTLFELFLADEAKALDAIVFNGFVATTDKATGQNIKPCIMSIQVARSEIESINLAQVDPKACFRKLKGVSAAKLQALAPVAPVAQINREDSRFVESYDVTPELDNSVNLASMDWEDFEHLIRELFGKEFAVGGGEVKVTQASRDGGVDAVAFDPDPIRGGKIVIQAKRYTNVVGVAAVRDLWGTISHEGAMKGILVTTSYYYYGPDAYEFAKGKPITLLDGGNLLHLLAKHGHRARINLREAKREMAYRNKEK